MAIFAVTFLMPFVKIPGLRGEFGADLKALGCELNDEHFHFAFVRIKTHYIQHYERKNVRTCIIYNFKRFPPPSSHHHSRDLKKAFTIPPKNVLSFTSLFIKGYHSERKAPVMFRVLFGMFFVACPRRSACRAE